MSTSYSIILKLNLKYSKENILKILENGLKNGFIYYNHDCDKGLFFHSPIINPLQVSDKIINNIGKDYGPSVLVKNEDTDFIFWLTPIDDLIELSISPFSDRWEKVFWNSKKNECGYVTYIDFSRYIFLLLKICKDFQIVSISTKTEY